MYDYDRSSIRLAVKEFPDFYESMRLLGFPPNARPTEAEAARARDLAVKKEYERGHVDVTDNDPEIAQYYMAYHAVLDETPEKMQALQNERDRERVQEALWRKSQIEAQQRRMEEERKQREEARARARELGPERRRLEKERLQALPENLRHERYPEARTRLLTELAAKGWQTKPNLKVPWAKDPYDRDHVLWFKSQAVYLDEHSMHIDIRGMPVEKLQAWVRRTVREHEGRPR